MCLETPKDYLQLNERKFTHVFPTGSLIISPSHTLLLADTHSHQ